jgi:hypothetical protein
MNGVLIKNDNDQEVVLLVTQKDRKTLLRKNVALGSNNLLNALDDIDQKKQNSTQNDGCCSSSGMCCSSSGKHGGGQKPGGEKPGETKKTKRSITLGASPFWKTNPITINDWTLCHSFIWTGLKEGERISKIMIVTGHLTKEHQQSPVKSLFRIYNQEHGTICCAEWTNTSESLIVLKDIRIQVKEQCLMEIQLLTTQESLDAKSTGYVAACEIIIKGDAAKQRSTNRSTQNRTLKKDTLNFRMVDKMISNI